ncbi:MAG: CRISPR-associated protein, partial [Chlorobi bacterium]|nr:CRISPR-associated protein [Chlorobiota bacterium]
MEYLYGASVQGIQEFVFKTNKLKEIAGASQLVDNICTSEFRGFCKKQKHTVEEENIIISAAGNIKYLISNDVCENIVRSFPKHISNYAPGITVSQAVVKRTGDLKKDIDDLELKLKAQRNKAEMPVDIGFMGLERARRTGGVAYTFDKENKHIDRATDKKISMPEEDTLRLFKKFKKDIKAKDVAFY